MIDLIRLFKFCMCTDMTYIIFARRFEGCIKSFYVLLYIINDRSVLCYEIDTFYCHSMVCKYA